MNNSVAISEKYKVAKSPTINANRPIRADQKASFVNEMGDLLPESPKRACG